MKLCGKFFGIRIKTVYNVNSQIVSEYKNDIEYQISQITDIQYLVKQINLNNGSIVELLFFKNNVGYLSSSDNGIDNIYLGECDNYIHNWSIPIDSNGNLTNSHTVMNRV